MTMLTKARQRVDAVARTSAERAIELKRAGKLTEMMTPDAYGGFGAWRDQTKGQEQYAMFRGVLYAAVNAIALHGAGQPVRIGVAKEADKQPKTQKIYIPGSKKILGRKEADEVEVVENHPLVEVLENPNPFQNRWQFTYMFLASINLTGRAFIVADAVKSRLELYALPTTWVEPIITDNELKGYMVGDPFMPLSMRQPFKPDQVVCAYLPHPGDPRLSYAPAESQTSAIRVDDKIWTSREVFFDNGIFPGCVVTVGQNPHPEAGSQAGRPLLTNTQRKQIHAAIKKVMGGIQNYGNPAIIDGLIERIDKLTMNSEEMGWERSSAETKTAILSAFAVHPYILGEHMPGSMAQARIIKELFYERVNMFLDMLGNCVSTFLANMGGDETVYVWWEPKTFTDVEMRWRQMMEMRKTGDVSQSELRTEAGLPPDEDETPDVISTHAPHIGQILALKGQGQIKAEQAVAFIVGLGVPKKLAEEIVGEDQPPPEQPPGGGGSPGGGPGGPPSGPGPSPFGKDLTRAIKALRAPPVDVSKTVGKAIVDESACVTDQDGVEPSNLETLTSETALAALQLKARVNRRQNRRKIAREVFERQEEELERKLVAVLEPLFEKQIEKTKERLLEMAPDTPKGMKETASPLAALSFDAKDPEWKKELIDRVLPVLAVGMLEGLTAEMLEVGVDPRQISQPARAKGQGGGRWVSTDDGARFYIGEDGVARTGPRGKVVPTKDSTPPIREFSPPPAPRGKPGGKAGGYTSTGHTNTEIGDAVEASSGRLGFESALEEGHRQGPFDLRFAGNPEYVFECKACTTDSTEYKAKPKKHEAEAKRAYAKKHGLKPCMMIAVVDVEGGTVDYYWREGIGAYRLSQSGKGWNYAGRARLKGV